MQKIRELNALVEILNKAGIERDKADDLVMKVAGIAQENGTSVIKTLIEQADSGAHEDSIEYQLFIALQSVSIVELHKLTSLT